MSCFLFSFVVTSDYGNICILLEVAASETANKIVLLQDVFISCTQKEVNIFLSINKDFCLMKMQHFTYGLIL